MCVGPCVCIMYVCICMSECTYVTHQYVVQMEKASFAQIVYTVQHASVWDASVLCCKHIVAAFFDPLRRT